MATEPELFFYLVLLAVLTVIIHLLLTQWGAGEGGDLTVSSNRR